MLKEGMTASLTHILTLLREPQPDMAQAIEEISSLLIQGPCLRERIDIKDAAVLILERLTWPALTGDRTKQAYLTRLIRGIRDLKSLDGAAIEPYVEKIAPWIEAVAKTVKRGELPPPFSPDLAKEALLACGISEMADEDLPFTLGQPTADALWYDLYRLLGRIILREQRSRAAWAREKRGLQEAIAILAGDLVESSLIISRKGEMDESWVKEASTKILTHPLEVMDALLAEEKAFFTRVEEAEAALVRSQEAVVQFQGLLRQAEHTLMDTRDETLVDIFTGLPNRFAFLARLAQVMEPLPGEKVPPLPFVVLFIRVDAYAEMLQAVGRNRVLRVMSALASRMALLVRPEDHLSRWSEETFALLCPGIEISTAVNIASTLHKALDRKQFELSDALVTVRLGIGVVPHHPDMSEEHLLGLAELNAKASLEEDAKPIQVA
ncbi:MAG: diguanylate cyclase [Magnetococcales bacterium]|nr:diguanylate cyclase [Magnetococcales bacterium]MBF0439822.1 diguanylate cyclase [Magnetococcales bacterium]